MIQRLNDDGVVERGEEAREIAASAPVEGANLWRLSGPEGATLFLLGTMHGKLLHKLNKRAGLPKWLPETEFDGVFAELERTASAIDAAAIVKAAKDLEQARAAKRQ